VIIQNIDPGQAAELLSQQNTVLIDVRTTMEYSFVGHPLNAIHIPWQESPGWQVNADFVAQVRAKLEELALDADSTRIITMCRSGKRSLDAAEALSQAEFKQLFNMQEGFEGDLDQNKQRNTINGWRQRGLPWEQS
jgi:rhodanese-related sulfurtransferase